MKKSTRVTQISEVLRVLRSIDPATLADFKAQSLVLMAAEEAAKAHAEKNGFKNASNNPVARALFTLATRGIVKQGEMVKRYDENGKYVGHFRQWSLTSVGKSKVLGYDFNPLNPDPQHHSSLNLS